MNSNGIKKLMLNLARVLGSGYPIKLTVEYKISISGVPYIKVNSIYNICYFAKSKKFRIWKYGDKLIDINKRNDVIDFLKNHNPSFSSSHSS